MPKVSHEVLAAVENAVKQYEQEVAVRSAGRAALLQAFGSGAGIEAQYTAVPSLLNHRHPTRTLRLAVIDNRGEDVWGMCHSRELDCHLEITRGETEHSCMGLHSDRGLMCDG